MPQHSTAHSCVIVLYNSSLRGGPILPAATSCSHLWSDQVSARSYPHLLYSLHAESDHVSEPDAVALYMTSNPTRSSPSLVRPACLYACLCQQQHNCTTLAAELQLQLLGCTHTQNMLGLLQVFTRTLVGTMITCLCCGVWQRGSGTQAIDRDRVNQLPATGCCNSGGLQVPSGAVAAALLLLLVYVKPHHQGWAESLS